MKAIFNRRERKEHKAFFYVIFARTRGALPFIVLTIFVVISRLSVFAQVTQAWVAKYNNGILNGTNQAVKMALDGAGNIYVTGFSQNATNGNLDYATIKYAPNGDQVWASRYLATNTAAAKPTGLVLDSNTNVIVTGTSVTVKYNTNGNQLWTASYAGNSVAVDGSNNVFVTGFSQDFGLVKLNSGGTNVWEKTYPSPYGVAVGQSLSVDSVGRVFEVGSYQFYNNPYPYYEMVAIKYDTNGSQLWNVNARSPLYGSPTVQMTALDSFGNLYVLWNSDTPYQTTKFAANNGSFVWEAPQPLIYTGYDDRDFANALAIDTGNNVAITGAFYVVTNNYGPAGSGRYGTFNINTNGAYIGTNLYPTVAVGNSSGTAIAIDQANKEYVTGYSPGTNTGNDIVTIKYDNNGNQIWLQRYNGPGNGDDEGNAIAVDALGNVYVTGYETTAAGGTEMVTIKYAPAASAQKQGNGSILLQEQGEPGEAFDFQASTNLQTWLDLGTTNADTNGFVQFLDTNAPNFSLRFYLSLPQ